jgi:hypothetical protein
MGGNSDSGGPWDGDGAEYGDGAEDGDGAEGENDGSEGAVRVEEKDGSG